MVIDGEAIAEINGVQHLLQANDTTWIPANLPHRFINASDKPMRIFWTYATIDATRTMVASGATRILRLLATTSPELKMTRKRLWSSASSATRSWPEPRHARSNAGHAMCRPDPASETMPTRYWTSPKLKNPE